MQINLVEMVFSLSFLNAPANYKKTLILGEVTHLYHSRTTTVIHSH